jgi:hypothetical protein
MISSGSPSIARFNRIFVTKAFLLQNVLLARSFRALIDSCKESAFVSISSTGWAAQKAYNLLAPSDPKEI